MYRECEAKIQKWIEESTKALLIYGARQVGKTYIIRKMLHNNGISFLEINLIEREDILHSIQTIDSASELSARLALYSDIPLTEKKSVIFLDEIQKYPEILTKIKFLVDEGRYRYVLSGSNLGVELEGIKSVPIGYMEQWQMYPMTFFEFSLAIGIPKAQWEHVLQCFQAEEEVDTVIHKRLIRAFYYYLISGGMPAAVKVFRDRHNLNDLAAEQKNIVNQYKADFIKYEAVNKRLRIVSIYDSIPAQLRKQDLRFTFTYLNKELKFDRYEQSFLWLADAGVAIPVFQAQEPKPPLEMSKASNRFKLFSSDVGLLTSYYSKESRQILLNAGETADMNIGAVFENYVAQELTAAALPVYYYKTVKIGEIDFMIDGPASVIPIEVKSGNDYRKHKALDNLLHAEEYKIDQAIVLSRFNVRRDGHILYLPIYMTRFLNNSSGDTYDFEIRL